MDMNPSEHVDLNDAANSEWVNEMARLDGNNVLGREFISVTDADNFYKNYSYCSGFSIRKDILRHDKHGLITVRRWVCSKQGYKAKKYLERTNRVREPKGKTREGCRAAMRINFIRERMLWVVTEFVTEHTHKCSPGLYSQFLRSHRIVKDSDLAQLQSLRSDGVTTSQVADHMVDQAGSYAAVGHTKKDLQNRFEAVGRYASHNSDVDSIIGYMTAKAQMEEGFFFTYTTLEDGSMGNLFWADAMSRCDYRYFGDVLCFDSTYRTNAYKRPLVIFVGVNNHIKTSIFGFGLLVDETIDTYTWVLQTFLDAMYGKCPISVVIDGDKVMSKAIKIVMPSAVRRLCSWHLERNAQTNIGDTGFTQAFARCMMTFMTECDFDRHWSNVVEVFGLQNNDWVKKIHSKRKLWAETFLRCSFFGGLRSTQRSESINSYLNRFLHVRFKLYEFMRQIDRAMTRLRNNELKDYFDCMNEHPVMVTHLEQLEKHAADVFTRNAYMKVRSEISLEAKLSIVNCVNGIGTTMFTMKTFDGRDKTWTVIYTPSEPSFKCACKMFEATGIPCCHLFSVMKAMDMHRIPDSLIMQRWTMSAKVLSKLESSSPTTSAIETARFGALSSKCNKLCYFASKTSDSYKAANLSIDNLTAQMQGLMPGSSSRQDGDIECQQPGHTAKTCHAHADSNMSAVGKTAAFIASETTSPTVNTGFFGTYDSHYNLNANVAADPFAFQNSNVPILDLNNPMADQVHTVNTDATPTFIDQNRWRGSTSLM